MGPTAHHLGDLYTTLHEQWPCGIMPDELANRIMVRVRRCLREIGYRVVFQAGEPWEIIIEHFAIASLERVNRGWSDNPWFWVVGWPAVVGAAAIDFFPDAGTPQARYMVASDATAAYFEALLMRRAIEEPDAKYMLPSPAVLGLRALGTDMLPAMPDQKKCSLPLVGSGQGEAWIRQHDKAVRSAQHLLRSSSQDPPQKTSSQSVPLAAGLEARVSAMRMSKTSSSAAAQQTCDSPDAGVPSIQITNMNSARVQPGRPQPDGESHLAQSSEVVPKPAMQTQAQQRNLLPPPTTPPPSIPSQVPLHLQVPMQSTEGRSSGGAEPTATLSAQEVLPLCNCGSVLEKVEVNHQVYGIDSCAICDLCYDLCSTGKWLHCKVCNFDLCSGCAYKRERDRNAGS